MKKRMISLLLTLALLLGMLPAITNTATAAGSASIVSAKLVLGNVLSANFNVDVKDGAAEDYSVMIKIGDDTVERAAVRASEPDANGYYVFTFHIAAHRMHETLHVSLKEGDTVLQSKDWTVQGYIDQLYNNRSDEKLMIDLADALSDYGKYAAYYTGKTNTDPAIADVTAVEAGDLDAFKPQSIVAYNNTDVITKNPFTHSGEDATEAAPEGYGTVTKLTTYWGKYDFHSADLTPYQEVRFAVKSQGYYGVMADGSSVIDETSNKGKWLEIKLVREGTNWRLYYGEKDEGLLTLANNNLTDLNFRFGGDATNNKPNINYVTELIGVTASLSPTTYLYVDDACDLGFRFNAEVMNGKQLFIDGKAVETTAVSGGKVEYRCKDILPQHWGESIHVAVKDGDTTVYEMAYSILSYARQVIRMEADSYAKLKGLMKAMYLYSAAAKRYSDGGEAISLADAPFAEGGTASNEVGVADGYTKATTFTKTWKSEGYAFDSMDLSDYSEVKFAVYSLAYHAIGLNGTPLKENSGNEWKEVRLVKNGANWDFYYADQPAQTITLPNNNLSDLALLTGGKDTYYFSEVKAIATTYISVMEQPFAVAGTASSDTPADGYSYDTTLTVAEYSYKGFADLDLTPYTELKFAVKAGSSQWYGIYYNKAVIGETDNGGDRLEIRLVRDTSGWAVYYGNTRKATVSLPNNNLSDLQFKFADNTTMHVTELQAVRDPAYTDPYKLIWYNPFAITDATAVDGQLYGTYQQFMQTTQTYGEDSFADIDLSKYSAVKFAVKTTSNSYFGAKSESVINEITGGNNWREFKLVKNTGGTNTWDLYDGGQHQKTLTLANNKLTDIKFHFGTGTYIFSELKGIPADGYENPWVNVALNPLTTPATTSTGRNLPSCAVEQVNFYEFTWNANFDERFVDGVELSEYTALKFYYKMEKNYLQMRAEGADKDIYAGSPTVWTEVLLEEQSDGTWTLYADGVSKATGLTGTTLTELLPTLAIGGNIYMTNLVGIPYVNEYVNVADNILTRKPDATDTSLPSKDVSGVNIYSGGWSATTFAQDIVLAEYTELKFYVKTTDPEKYFEMYDAKGTQICAPHSQEWTEVKLVSNGDSWVLYLNGTARNNVLTGETLGEMFSKVQLGGSATADVYVTNLVGKKNPDYKYVSDYVNVSDNALTLAPTDTRENELPSLDVGKVNTYYSADYDPNAKSFAEVNVLKYTELKFYWKQDANRYLEFYLPGVSQPIYQKNHSEWTEIKFTSTNGIWTLYENEVLIATNLSGNTLSEMISSVKFGGTGKGNFYITNLIGIEQTVLPLVENGATDYVIVCDNDAPSWSASEALQKYFELATGNKLNVTQKKWVNSLADRSILIGKELALEAGLTLDGLSGPSDYAIKTVDEKIYIYGNCAQGTTRGVYAFLEQYLGLKVFSKDVYHINTVSDLLLQPCETVVQANFDYLFAGYGEINATCGDTKYASSMGFVTDYLVSTGSAHNALQLISEAEFGVAHPEWFYTGTATSGGTGTQLYLAAENFATGDGTLVATVAAKLLAIIESQPNMEIFGFSPMDIDIWPTGTGYENSDTLKTTYGTNSAEYIIFMNAVAKELEKKLGDRQIKLQLLAYNKTLVAPDLNALNGLTQAEKDAIKLYSGSNIQVVPYIAPVEANFHMAFTDTRNTVKNPATGVIDSNSKTVAQVIQGWHALGDELHLWWYGLDAANYFMVMDTYTNMGANYWFAYQNGVKVMFTQAQYDTPVSTDWARMKMYLQSALAKNIHTLTSADEANAFVQTEIDKFMAAYFGAGATSMKQLLDAQKTWYQTILNISASDKLPYWMGKLRGSDWATYQYIWTENGKANFFESWLGTSADPDMIIQWMGYIDAAKAAINADTTLSADEKDELIKRVNLESLTARYVLVKIFQRYTYDSDLEAFKTAAADLGMTHYKEGGKLSDLS